MGKSKSKKSIKNLNPNNYALPAESAKENLHWKVEVVNSLGTQANQAVSTIASAIVESRRIDMEGLESSDKAEVLKAEGTTLVQLVESNNQVLVEGAKAIAPLLATFLGQMVQVESVRAEARLNDSQANLLNAESRAKEAEVKVVNAETERIKAEAARMRAEAELKAAREREASRREARWTARDDEMDKLEAALA